MNKQHSLIDLNEYNVIDIDNRVLNVIQKKANICFKINRAVDKLGELKENNSTVDINFISNKLNFLFLNINDDINRLMFIDKELDIIINNLYCYANSKNLIKK